MTTPLVLLMAVLGFLAAGLVLVYHVASLGVWCLGKLFQGVGAITKHTLGFVKNEAIEGVQTAGALLSSAAIAPLAVGNLAIARWASAKHYGRALRDEATSSVAGLYRLVLANPLRFLGLGAVIDRVEGRLPRLIERAPRHEPMLRLRKAVEPPPFVRSRAVHATLVEGAFEGYEVVGELPPGGSGARLFLARPLAETVARLKDSGVAAPDEVVIKSFAIAAGSTLPQIVREGRALEAARRLGLVLQHSLDEERFWYVMPYVRGLELGDVSTNLHVKCGAEGLDETSLRRVASYTQDVLTSLERFHEDGLWHKDVKPSNVVVAEEKAHLVDLGLVTPLASAMTLTTHGTEYYRDPELVRQALRGAKVNEVDGVKFDLYATGAVLYSMVENSFPAHGNLSRITKRCPEALAFIVRRAMADHADRYSSAAEMRADLAVLVEASTPFEVRPAQLPSFQQAMREEDRSESRSKHGPGTRTLRAGAPSAQRAAAVEPDDRRGAAASRPLQPSNGDRSPRRRRRRRQGLATFALMFCAVLALTKILPAIVDGADQGRSRDGNNYASRGWFADKYRSATASREEPAPDWEAQAQARAAAERAEAEQIAALWQAEVAPLVQHEDVGGLPDWSRGANVLVLNDVLDNETALPLEPLMTLLEESGYGVIGSAVDRADSELALELEASARHALGLSNGADDEALGRLQDFLDASTELHAVVWIALDDVSGEPDRVLLLPSSAPHRPLATENEASAGIVKIGAPLNAEQEHTYYGIDN